MLRWHETRGGSVDEWMALIDDNIQFGSLAQSAPQMTFADRAMKAARRSKAISTVC